MSTVRLPVSCEDHDVTVILGDQDPDQGSEVIGLYCVECDAFFYAEGSCPDCNQLSEHAFNCQMNWV